MINKNAPKLKSRYPHKWTTKSGHNVIVLDDPILKQQYHFTGTAADGTKIDYFRFISGHDKKSIFLSKDAVAMEIEEEWHKRF